MAPWGTLFLFFFLFAGFGRAVPLDGIGIDPHGGGPPRPGRVQSDAGVRIDPEGVAAQPDEGNGLDPHGGRVDQGTSLDPDGLAADNGCGIDPNG